MPVTLTKASTLAKTRAQAAFADVFVFLKKDGTRKDKQFLSVGSSDRMFSVNTATGELSSSPTAKGTKKIAVIGQCKLEITLFKDSKDYRKEFRAQLRVGDVYRAKDDGATYMHLGHVTDGTYLAFNTKTHDIVRGRKAEKEVVVVGFGQFSGTTTV